MSVKAGLVGLPNVGKSTLFNALTKAGVPAHNYPFCTIDPHEAITEVPDSRCTALQALYSSGKIIPATVTFVDIAGLVKGAASGEGLGNQFLSHIKEVDLIIHVLRCFEDPDIVLTQEKIDPCDDYDIISTELLLKDLEAVTKRCERLPTLIRKASTLEKKDLEHEYALLEKIKDALNAGDSTRVKALIEGHEKKTVPLLSTKKSLIIANMSEKDIENYEDNQYYQSLIKRFGKSVIPICAKIEGELSCLPDEEAEELMNLFGLKERGIAAIICATYVNLDLITFFTCGPQEIHSWPVKKGISIREAAGKIHSDLERGFICSEVFNCTDLFAIKSLVKLKELGKIRTEGHDYRVADGDIIHVRFNV